LNAMDANSSIMQFPQDKIDLAHGTQQQAQRNPALLVTHSRRFSRIPYPAQQRQLRITSAPPSLPTETCGNLQPSLSPLTKPIPTPNTGAIPATMTSCKLTYANSGLPQPLVIRPSLLPFAHLRPSLIATHRTAGHSGYSTATASLRCLHVAATTAAGHSKWANIKHAKGAADSRRAKVFLKVIHSAAHSAPLC